jgi:hypothetical protein
MHGKTRRQTAYYRASQARTWGAAPSAPFRSIPSASGCARNSSSVASWGDVDPASPDLLDQLPVGDAKLSSAPEHVLRRMFESFRLQVRYDQVASRATCRVAIREEALEQLLTVSSALFAAQTNDPDGGRSFWLVPPAGFEPAHRAPEARALSPELRGRPG